MDGGNPGCMGETPVGQPNFQDKAGIRNRIIVKMLSRVVGEPPLYCIHCSQQVSQQFNRGIPQRGVRRTLPRKTRRGPHGAVADEWADVGRVGRHGEPRLPRAHRHHAQGRTREQLVQRRPISTHSAAMSAKTRKLDQSCVPARWLSGKCSTWVEESIKSKERNDESNPPKK